MSNKCPHCNKRITVKALNTPYQGVRGVYECPTCGAILGSCYKGDSYGIVKPFMVNVEPPAERVRYYDLRVLGSDGISRRHGFFDTVTGLIVQIG